MKGIVIIELKGFSEAAKSLVYRMEKIELEDTQVKLKYRNIIDSIVTATTTIFPATEIKKIGGDTWVIQFENLETAIKSASHIYQVSYEEVVKTGLFYVKPVIAVGQANTQFEGERFLDTETINIYRVADSGEPYALYLVDSEPETHLKVELSLNPKLESLQKTINFHEIDWRSIEFNEEQLSYEPAFYLSSLLRENDIAFFKSNKDSFNKFVELQNQSKLIYAFGGPIRYKSSEYDNYARSIFDLFENKPCKCYVMSYIDPNGNLTNNYYWLKLCQTFIRDYDGKFTYSFYEVDTSEVKPLAYHIYDEKFIQLVLRNYNPAENESIMSSSILMRNELLAEKYINEFLENFRRVSNQTPESLGIYLDRIQLPKEKKEEIDNYISNLKQNELS